MSILPRRLAAEVLRRLRLYRAVAILGPRQCGKSTLALSLLQKGRSVYLDLEKPSDLAKIQDPEAFFRLHQGRLVCLDEIQRRQDLFAPLRGILDENRRNGQVLLLGSASPDLLRQGSESLAGRISFLELTPFLPSEIMVSGTGEPLLRRLRLRGGFPKSFLARSEQASFEWREDFIRTFLERDVPNLGFRVAAETLGRFWRMCAHNHGQLINTLQLGQSLGISHTTIRSYMDILSSAFVLRSLKPILPNLKKRLVKSPKVYIRDSGLLHALLGLKTFDELLGHPVYGASWEGFVLESVLAGLRPGWQAGFYRTSNGTEIDLVIERGGLRYGIECKASSAPSVGKGFWIAVQELGVKKAFVAAPVQEPYPIGKGAWVMPLASLLEELNRLS